jgi:hypothetical protein
MAHADRSRAVERRPRRSSCAALGTMPGNIRIGVHNPREVRSGVDQMRVIAPVLIALMLALSVSGCDKCGDYFWQNGAKTCHDESQVK